MKRRTAWVLVAGVAAVAVGAAAVGGLALVLRGGRSSGPLFSDHSYLYLHLDGELPEQSAPELSSFFERHPPSLRTIVESLDRAAADPKITGVMLRVGNLPGAGWGRIQELRDAVERYRRSGKPAYAHLEICGNKEYYLATACSKIYAVPAASVDVTALATEVTFFRKTLDKLGVEAQFEGVGKYKNAPNQFTETGFTAPHREQMDSLLDSLNREFLAAIGKARGKTPAQVQALVEDGPYDAESALKAGLVDELLYLDEVEGRLKNASRLTPGPYTRGGHFGLDTRPKVALVYVVGEIREGESQGGGPLGGSSSSGSDTVAAAIRRAREDDSIRAIVVRVDSPGGVATAADVMWREMGLARKSKPVVVSMGDYAASGGYYVAVAADHIVAEPGTITGSIGVFSGKFNLHGLYDKLGLTKEILTRGRNGDLFSEYRPWNAEERQKIRTLTESVYHDFVTKVAEGRKRSYDEIHQVAQGRVWTGVDARRVGLVDSLGGLDAALGVAKERAHIAKDQEVAVVVLPERKGLFETLMERQQDGVLESLPLELRTTLTWLGGLADGRPLARIPFDLTIR